MYKVEFSNILEASSFIIASFIGLYYIFKNISRIGINHKENILDMEQDIDYFESDYLKIFNWQYYIKKSKISKQHG